MRDVLFIGAVLASVTHEMQNVMAIIKESGALTDDILELNGRPRLRHGDKLTTALTNIQEQVGRGRNLMLMLNGFAHAAADFPQAGDLLRFARQIAVLAERPIRLKECTLETDLEGAPLPVRGNALMLMQTLYLGLTAVLDSCRPGDTLLMATVIPEKSGPENGGPEKNSKNRTIMRISAKESRETPACGELNNVLAELGGECRAGAGHLDLWYETAAEAGA